MDKESLRLNNQQIMFFHLHSFISFNPSLKKEYSHNLQRFNFVK